MEFASQDQFLYGDLTARIRKMLEPVAHDSFLFFEDTIGLLQSQISADKKILDAGCGRGTYTAWLAERGCRVVSIDSNPAHIARTKDLLREAKLENHVRLETSKLPDAFPQDHFDIVLDCFSWWHISDWGRLFNLTRKNLKPHGKLLILDTLFGWKTTVNFRQQVLERWRTAFPTYNECRNMLVKREFRLLKEHSIQDAYIRYLDSLCEKIRLLEKEDLGASDPLELNHVKSMWEWFRNAAHEEQLVATFLIAELT
jgi:cyclopropane fatty-acyl-phospholipid synthase-like methyltransferase